MNKENPNEIVRIASLTPDGIPESLFFNETPQYISNIKKYGIKKSQKILNEMHYLFGTDALNKMFENFSKTVIIKKDDINVEIGYDTKRFKCEPGIKITTFKIGLNTCGYKIPRDRIVKYARHNNTISLEKATTIISEIYFVPKDKKHKDKINCKYHQNMALNYLRALVKKGTFIKIKKEWSCNNQK